MEGALGCPQSICGEQGARLGESVLAGASSSSQRWLPPKDVGLMVYDYYYAYTDENLARINEKRAKAHCHVGAPKDATKKT